jgi:hypothetical protein
LVIAFSVVSATGVQKHYKKYFLLARWEMPAAGGEIFGVFGCVWAAWIDIYGGQMISAHHGRV